jgi:hypothetical protein
MFCFLMILAYYVDNLGVMIMAKKEMPKFKQVIIREKWDKCGGNHAAMAEELGVRPQTVAAWTLQCSHRV